MLLEKKRNFHLFDSMTDAHIILIVKYVGFKSFRKGDILIEDHDQTQTVYFILSGECEATVSGVVVGKLTPNTVVGEMSGISTGRRQATVIATTDLQVIELLIGYENFEKYTVPFSYFYRNLSVSLIQKITETNANK